MTRLDQWVQTMYPVLFEETVARSNPHLKRYLYQKERWAIFVGQGAVRGWWWRVEYQGHGVTSGTSAKLENAMKKVTKAFYTSLKSELLQVGKA
jgi:hypothetical protein